MKLRVSDDFSLPLDWLSLRTVVYGNSGTGKTVLGRVLAEETHRIGHRFLAIDIKGDWCGLRTSADGKSPGIPVVIFGGDHADVPLEPDAGEWLGETVAKMSQSVILDLEHLSKGQQVRFLAKFFAALYHHNRDPLVVFLDESQRYAPQKPMSPDAVVCLGATEDLVKLGRKHGIFVVVITQRGSGTNKEVTELCDMMVAFRAPGVLDRKRVKEWCDANATEEQSRLILAEISRLPTGTAFFVSAHPKLDLFKRVACRMSWTFDSGATPEAGKRRRAPLKLLAEPDLDALRARMAEAIERQRADDPKLLRARIAELERAAKVAPKVVVPKAVPVATPKVVVKREVVADARLVKVLARTTEKSAAAIATVRDLLGSMEQVSVRLDAVGRRLDQQAGGMLAGKVTAEQFVRAGAPGMHLGSGTEAIARGGQVVVRPRPPQRAASTVQVVQPPARTFNYDDGSPITLLAGERRMLQVCAQRHPVKMTRSQIGVLAGFAPSGGTFKNYIGRLKKLQFIIEKGDEIEITADGYRFLGSDVPPAPASTAELQEMWRSRLLKGEREILDYLIRIYPRAIGRQEIGAETGYEASGGTFKNYLGTLKRNQLAEEHDGEVRASPTLFMEGE